MTRTARWKRRAVVALAAAGLVVVCTMLLLRAALTASLARDSGVAVIVSLGAPVEVSLDALAVPEIRAASLEDAVRAQGFLHGQERFFQMDTTRRYAAGELAEVVGPPALDSDLAMRRLRFRAHARRAMAEIEPRHAALLTAYAQGVNAGLADLGGRPPEYWALRATPAPWAPEDSLLIIFAMFDMLDISARAEKAMGVLHEALPPEMVAFLTPDVTRFDAPLLPDAPPRAYRPAPVPGPGVLDLRTDTPITAPPRTLVQPDAPPLGSNNWAVDGSRTAHGGAMLANDMHLGISAPGIWRREQLVWPGHTAVGVSLPGVPGIVAGATERLAWGFTNTSGDFQDLIIVEEVGERGEDGTGYYRTPDGVEPFGEVVEHIASRGRQPQPLVLRTTRWGPVTDVDHRGRPLVLKWSALEPGGINLRLFDMMHAQTLEEGVRAMRGWRGPSQNALIASADGRIAWVVTGFLPRREGFTGEVPVSWAEPGVGWAGPLDESRRPVVVDPESGVLYTANNRAAPAGVSGAVGRAWALGGRAARIAEMLEEGGDFTETDFLRMQLDTRSALHDFYRDLALEIVPGNEPDGLLSEARAVIDGWSGGAAADDTAFALLRAFRRAVFTAVFNPVVASAADVDPGFRYGWWQAEEPLRRILEERPPHLLSPAHESWDALLRAALLDAAADIARRWPDTGVGTPWGDVNRARIRHELSGAVPALSPLLDMPADPLPGSADTVRVSAPTFGASERLAVSPSRLGNGLLHIPAGQSGHFLSMHYDDGHAAWVRGEATPLLSGPPVRTFRLQPAPPR